jgi:enoyl-CoA hydratase/carnithine racemase
VELELQRKSVAADNGVSKMADQNYDWISYKLADGVATITFNAPQFGNALGLKGLQELLDALYRSEAREQSRLR